MKKIAIACFAMVAFVVLAGCNTIHGVGQDVQDAGQSIKKAAD